MCGETNCTVNINGRQINTPSERFLLKELLSGDLQANQKLTSIFALLTKYKIRSDAIVVRPSQASWINWVIRGLYVRRLNL